MHGQLTLYHAAPSRSSIVRWMLEEIGEPYDVHLLDLKTGENRQPGYLAVNPMGKVPALKHGDAVITEVAAICLYLADTFPHAGLTVPGRGSAPRTVPQVAVLQPGLPGAGRDRPGVQAGRGSRRAAPSATATSRRP